MMSNNKRRKQKFFSEHSKCCFCGGDTPAVEQDHFPSRAIFDDRQWPEGFVFPACSSCNRSSSRPEIIISFLSRVHTIEENEKHSRAIEKCLTSIEYNYPGLLKQMQLSSRQARNAVKLYGLPKPENSSYSELPLLSLDSPIINEAVTIFGVKLMLALYYKHLGKALPASGGIALKWFSNLQILNGEIPEEIRSSLTCFSVTQRCNTSLQDQFFYQYGKSEKEGAGFLAVFRMSFAIVGIVKKDVSELNIKDRIKLYKPLSEGLIKRST